MKSIQLLIGLATIGGLSAGEDPKVNYSMPVDPGDVNIAPYVYNGLVLTDSGRASGFVAEDRQLFFSAAHAVFDEETGWGVTPTFTNAINSDSTDPDAEIPSRGYFRLNAYAALAGNRGTNFRAAFSKDVMMAFAFERFTDATPPMLNLRGHADLRREDLTIITGYPAEVPYSGESGGYYLHSTTPEIFKFNGEFANYITTTHVSTGPGNSGGPVLRQDRNGNWMPAGILVSGLTAESGVYGFNRDSRQLINAAKPLLRVPMRKMRRGRGVGFSNGFYSYHRKRPIPDGRAKWSRLPLRVNYFPRDSEVTRVVLNLTVETEDRSDLVVRLVAPGGTYTELFSLEDPGLADLVFEDEDLSSEFAGLQPNGNWQIYIQDRIRGDRAVVTEYQLDISVDAQTTVTEEP